MENNYINDDINNQFVKNIEEIGDMNTDDSNIEKGDNENIKENKMNDENQLNEKMDKEEKK